MQTPNVRLHLNRNHLFRVFPPLSLLASSLVRGAGGGGGVGGCGGGGGERCVDICMGRAWGMGTMETFKELVCSNLSPNPLPCLKFSFCCHLYLEGLLYLNRYIDNIQ